MRNFFLKTFIFLNLIFLISNNALANAYLYKGVSAGKCKGVIELYNIDNKRATQVLKSVYQSFLTGYNLSYYEKTGKFKNLDLKSEYIFNAIMNDCRKNKNAYLSNILTDFWGNLDWGKR